MPGLSSESIESCTNACKDQPECCMTDCSFKAAEFFEEGKIENSKISQLFTSERMSKAEMSEIWLPEIEKSIETCKKLSKRQFR